MKVMSAWLKPTWGLAAAMFSTLAAITPWSLTAPPVRGLVSFCGGLVAGSEGTDVGTEAPVGGELVIWPPASEPLITAPRPMPAAIMAAAAMIASARRERLINEWA